MAREFKISPTRQFNIDAIKRIRLELDISGSELSLEISVSKNRSLVGSMESAGNNASYTDHRMNQIAIYFSKVAKARQAELDGIPGNQIKLKTDFTIYDFYPEEPLSEELQIKTSTPIPRDGGVTATLNAVLESSDFFNSPKSLKEIIEHFNILQNKSWTNGDFTAILERAQKKGKLKFIHLPDGTVRYQKT